MINYTTEFHDIAKLPAKDLSDLYWDFNDELSCFLVDHCETPHPVANAIAGSVWKRMTSTNLHYHTPYHVMQMLAFAELHNIALEPWEELAIWFHDVIYWPGKGFGPSERASGEFMVANLPPDPDIFSPDPTRMSPYAKLVRDAHNGIMATAEHLFDGIDPKYARILDLDVNTFLATGPMAREINDCLAAELCPHSATAWVNGRMSFLKKLVAKGRHFRSPEFARFEAQAMGNIQEQIADCEQWLASEENCEC